MCVRHNSDPTLEGKLRFVSFAGLNRDRAIQNALGMLSETVDGPQVDIVTRFPSGVEHVKTKVDDDLTRDSRSLSIETLSRHALATVHECTDEMEWLSAPAENALLVDHAEDYEWETEYLRSAREHESFYQDLRSFVADAMRYSDIGEATDPVINDLFNFVDSFYTMLVDRGYVPREAVVRLAVEQFRKQGMDDVSPPDGILAVQFAEFTAVERSYLAYLTQDTEFQAVARENASIFRTQFEEGRIRDQTSLDIIQEQVTSVPWTPKAVGQWLAEGGSVSLNAPETVRKLEAETYEEHVRTIGTEIQNLQSRGSDLHNIAVVFRDTNAPIGDAVDVLWSMGVPVSSTVAGGLEHDTAVRELYTVVDCLSRMERGVAFADLTSLTRQLEAHLTDTDPIGEPSTVVKRVLTSIAEAGTETLEYGLGLWITETQLKHRIATEDDALQQRLRFDHVRHVLSVAQFLDRSSDVEGSWRRFRRALEFEADYTASEQVAAELESQEVGVTVDTVGSLRGADFKYVFAAGTVDEEYPAGPTLNRLIPITRAPDIDVYPRALPDTMTAMRETFATPEPPTEDPVRAYSQALNRRMLGEVARMAGEGVYFVTYETSTRRVNKQVHPSRYLSALDDAIGGMLSDSGATEAAVPERVALETVDERHRTAVLDAESLPDEETLTDEFGAIRTVLEESEESFREALASRRDWSRGVVGDE